MEFRNYYLCKIEGFKQHLVELFKDIDKNLRLDEFDSFSFGTHLLPEYEKLSVREHLVDGENEPNEYRLFF